jgi:hypothetical protein
VDDEVSKSLASNLRGTAIVFCIKVRNAREETCNLIVVVDPQAELHRAESDIIGAERYEMQNIVVLFLGLYNATRIFSSQPVVLVDETTAVEICIFRDSKFGPFTCEHFFCMSTCL